MASIQCAPCGLISSSTDDKSDSPTCYVVQDPTQASCIPYSLIDCDDCLALEIEEAWCNFKKEFRSDIVYDCETEQKRKGLFKSCYLKVREHNELYRQGKTTYSQEINNYSDWTEKEISNLYGDRSEESEEDSSDDLNKDRTTTLGDFVSEEKKKKTPRKFQYDERSLQPIQDQGELGSCFAFASASSLEVAFYKRCCRKIRFSEQELVDCSGASSVSYDDEGKLEIGGRAYKCFKFAQKDGVQEVKNGDNRLAYEEKYNGPKNEICQRPGRRIKIRGFRKFAHLSDEELMHLVYHVGTPCISMDTDRGFSGYKYGIYNGCKGKISGSHAVTIVGYDADEGYWLCRNSWGDKKWGEKGYFRLQMGGQPTCDFKRRIEIPYF